jgi:hypothetical protein
MDAKETAVLSDPVATGQKCLIVLKSRSPDCVSDKCTCRIGLLAISIGRWDDSLGAGLCKADAEMIGTIVLVGQGLTSEGIP